MDLMDSLTFVVTVSISSSCLSVVATLYSPPAHCRGRTQTVTWRHKKCHMTTQEMSHDNTSSVTWQHEKCHMTTQVMSHDDTRNVTWQHKICHMTTQEMSHYNTRNVTWRHKIHTNYTYVGIAWRAINSRVWQIKSTGLSLHQPHLGKRKACHTLLWLCPLALWSAMQLRIYQTLILAFHGLGSQCWRGWFQFVREISWQSPRDSSLCHHPGSWCSDWERRIWREWWMEGVMDGGRGIWREWEKEERRDGGMEGKVHFTRVVIFWNSTAMHAVSCANADRKITFSQIPASLYQHHRVQCSISHCALYSTEVWLVHITQCI